MSLRLRGQAVAYARQEKQSASRDWTGWCLVFVRTCFGVSSRYPSAENAYYNTQHKMGTSSTPPVGVPIWWTNGRFGHVAISSGNGWCFSTDILRTGKVDRVRIDYITRAWGQTYRGWTKDINGVVVYDPKPTLSKAERLHRRSLRQAVRRARANLQKARAALKKARNK